MGLRSRCSQVDAAMARRSWKVSFIKPVPWSVRPAGVASCRAASCAPAAGGDYKLVTQGNTIIFGPGRAPLELYRLLKGALLFRACYKPQKAAG